MSEQPMMTRWGRQVTPDNAWREYPRSQMQRDRWLSLNGSWRYAITPVTSSCPTESEWQGNILVPFAVESTLSGVGKRICEDERLWYRRSFTVPADWQSEDVILHLDALDYSATIWINDGLVAHHLGGSEPIRVNITPFLQARDNQLTVAVTDPGSLGEQARGKQINDPDRIWYTPVTGIWQSVWLEPVSRDHAIAEVRLMPRFTEPEAS